MIDILIGVPETYRARATYIFGMFMDILGLKHRFLEAEEAGQAGRAGQAGEIASQGDLLLYYGDLPGDCRRQGGRGQLCIQAVLGEEAPDEIRHLRWGDRPLPVLFWKDVKLSGTPLIHFSDAPGPAAVFQEESRRILVSADLMWSCFYLVSRREEHDPEMRDELGRFSSAASLAFRQDFLRFPVVDATVALLDALLARLYRAGRTPCLRTARWPGGRRWALCLSHDVDWVKKWTPGGMVKYLFRLGRPRGWADGNWRRLKTVLQDLRAGRDPYDNIELILDLESDHQAVSTFFFLPGAPDTRRAGRKILGKYPGRFDVGLNARRIRQAGGEVELHGSFGSYDDEAQLAREREMLQHRSGSWPRGVRQHFLRYRFPETARCHDEIGMAYDSTLGFGDHPGYRCGISFPYHLFDLSEDRCMRIMEIPLVIMDGALNVIPEEGTEASSWATVDELLGRAEQFGGVCTLLWHNTSFAQGDDGGLLRSIYLRSLQRARGSQAWLCSCGQLMDWWRWRSGIELDAETSEPEGEHRWRLRLPSGAQQPLVLEFLGHGSFRPEITGGRGRVLSGGKPGEEGWVGLEISDWDRQELSIRLIPPS